MGKQNARHLKRDAALLIKLWLLFSWAVYRLAQVIHFHWLNAVLQAPAKNASSHCR
jgi:hypothetical protein